MATITPNKTDSVVVLAHTNVDHPTTLVGSSIAALTKRSVTIFMYHGYREAGQADTNPGKFKVQIRPNAGDGSVNEHWKTIAEYVAKGTTPSDEALDATEPVGETVIALTLTATYVAEDLVYFANATEANAEWAEIITVVTDATIEIMNGLTNEQASGTVVFNDATAFVCPLDLNANESYRVVWSHEGAVGANGAVLALAITHDSDNSA